MINIRLAFCLIFALLFHAQALPIPVQPGEGVSPVNAGEEVSHPHGNLTPDQSAATAHSAAAIAYRQTANIRTAIGNYLDHGDPGKAAQNHNIAYSHLKSAGAHATMAGLHHDDAETHPSEEELKATKKSTKSANRSARDADRLSQEAAADMHDYTADTHSKAGQVVTAAASRAGFDHPLDHPHYGIRYNRHVDKQKEHRDTAADHRDHSKNHGMDPLRSVNDAITSAKAAKAAILNSAAKPHSEHKPSPLRQSFVPPAD